jgi:hypothetical protein
MGEGVDPTQMCQSLVNKVARSEQLLAIADPDGGKRWPGGIRTRVKRTRKNAPK